MRSIGVNAALRAMVTAAILGIVACYPSYADPLNPLDFSSLGTVNLGAGSWTINTDTATLSGPSNYAGTIYGAGGENGVAVFSFDSLNISSEAIINVTGRRPAAFLSAGNLTLGGTLNAINGNAGGGAGGRGTTYVGGTNYAYSATPGAGLGGGKTWDYPFWVGGGGGGGGFGGSGGAGGLPGNWSGSGGNGGTSYGNLLSRLDGGSGGGGGSGAENKISLGDGGGGGGCIELGALCSVTVSGQINVSGGAGSSQNDVSGGGGSGGGVLIHAATVSLPGAVYAIGGSGGGSTSLYDAGGGGGAGGRVAIQSPNTVTTSSIHVAGGGGGYLGGASGSIGDVALVRGILTPTNLDFGPIRVGASKTAFMGVQNSGDAGTSINGQFPLASGAFSGGGDVFSALHQNRYAAAPYSFSPAAAGSVSEPLTFLSDGGPAAVTLSGLGVGPVASSSVPFGSTLDVGARATASLTIANMTLDDPYLPDSLIGLTLESYTITGPDAALFSISGFAPGEVLGAGDLGDLSIHFSGVPGVGNPQATLTILTDQSAAFGSAGQSLAFGLTATPEPSSLVLLGVGTFGLLAYVWRRRAS